MFVILKAAFILLGQKNKQKNKTQIPCLLSTLSSCIPVLYFLSDPGEHLNMAFTYTTKHTPNLRDAEPPHCQAK